ncbi:MAG: hypothetical protein IKN12_01505 [Selenomonadaceae bacterium]|nr:hypothetical protein [Selenomonadaceae bacterium]
MKHFKILPVTLFMLMIFVSSGFAAHTAKSQGFSLTVPDDIYPLLKIETSNDPNSIFRVSELGSVKAAKKLGENADGAGFLFSVSKISKDRLHKILQGDASGIELFATDDNGGYYIYNHPTDVRYVRENNALMKKDQPVWNKVNDWAYTKVRKNFAKKNKLRPLTANNTDIGIAVARVLYDQKLKYTLTATGAGTLTSNGVDPEKYLNDLLYDAKFYYSHDPVPDGEYIGLYFPDEKIMYKFYKGKQNYVTRESENIPTMVYKGELQNAGSASVNIARLYQAMAEKAGKIVTASGDSYIGSYHEIIAGRGYIDIVKKGKIYKINIKWGESAAAASLWNMTAKFEKGALVYNDCKYRSIEINQRGTVRTKRSYNNGKGRFVMLTTGELVWEDNAGKNSEYSVFVKN